MIAQPEIGELKPCPWCGPDGSVMLSQKGGAYNTHKVLCIVCRCSGPDDEDPAEAVRAWNERSDAAEQRACKNWAMYQESLGEATVLTRKLHDEQVSLRQALRAHASVVEENERLKAALAVERRQLNELEGRRMSVGRPNEGRVRIVAHVLPLTAERIAFLLDKTDAKANTIGKVVDSQFGVRASKKVAGAGRKAPRGQHGRAKRSSSRAKRANDASERLRGGNPTGAR